MALNAQAASFAIDQMFESIGDKGQHYTERGGGATEYKLVLPGGVTERDVLSAVKEELERPIDQGGQFGLSIGDVLVNTAQPGIMARINPPPGGIPEDLR